MIKKMLPLNLQFFAENNNDDNNNDNDVNSNVGNEGNKDDHTEGGEKTFTQEEVNKMMANEKRQGRSAAIRALGFESEEDAKNAFNLLKALTDSQKTEEQKANEKKDNATKEASEANKRAELAEAKLSCLMNGVDKDSIDDVLSIASGKITDGKTLDDVISEMKENKRYSSFFNKSDDNDDEKNKGTGRTPGHSKHEGEENPSDYGQRLAKANANTNTKKSTYF